MKNDVLSLIGCGWLGSALASELMQTNDYRIVAMTAHDKSSDNISYITLDLNLKPTLPESIKNSNVFIYTIPPLDLSLVKHFFDQIPVDKKILFTSSTSVYGKNLGVVDETFIPKFDQTNSPLLIETENYLRERFSFLTIIRPGGLYGIERHPIFFLQGKQDLKTGQELLHLAHQEDCIKSIKAILQKNLWGETINIVSDLRIPKKDYYINMAQKLSLQIPQYSEGETLEQTNISNKKSKILLGIDYLDPNEFCKSSV